MWLLMQKSSKGPNPSWDTLNKLRFNKHYHISNNNRVNENESVDEKVALENLLLDKSWVALNELGFNKDYHKSSK